jgi:hypothetical protein
MKILANYLPGFHCDNLNSEWWGDGFTEWDNVKNSEKLFPKHNQPRNPSLGYLDLSKIESLKLQCSIAKNYGISGFVIYNYWYNGKKILHQPLDLLYENSNIDIEYYLCWGNHDWTRSWTNRSGALDTLIKQEYNLGNDCLEHAKYLSKYFMDDRYIKIDNKPVFQVYDLNEENKCYLFYLKKILYDKYKINIFLLQTIKNPKESKIDISDSEIYFQPSFNLKQKSSLLSILIKATNSLPFSIKKVFYQIYDKLPSRPVQLNYDAVCNAIVSEYENKRVNSILSMFIDFDNTPRYKSRARYFYNFSLDKFQDTFKKILAIESYSNIYVINAWNEWGEGMYLEPDDTYDYKKLECIKKLLELND